MEPFYSQTQLLHYTWAMQYMDFLIHPVFKSKIKVIQILKTVGLDFNTKKMNVFYVSIDPAFKKHVNPMTCFKSCDSSQPSTTDMKINIVIYQ